MDERAAGQGDVVPGMTEPERYAAMIVIGKEAFAKLKAACPEYAHSHGRVIELDGIEFRA